LAQNAFFDVLIDQIIQDVRMELDEGKLHLSSSSSSSETHPLKSKDDLVAKLLDFRLRRQNENTRTVAVSSSDYRRDRSSVGLGGKSERRLQMEMLIGAGHPDFDRVARSPGFSSAEAETAFEVIARFGAKFHIHDFDGHQIFPEALKRERRRLLLSLHPDRHPESAKRAAHLKFLEVADAFTVLAQTVMSESERSAA
jgi:hypothetical protein